jgi:predicted transcriptional regulator
MMTEAEMRLVELGVAIERARKKYERERFELTVEFGTELRERREAKKMTLRALAEALDVTAPFLSDVEHGRRRLSIEHATKADEILR